MTLRTGRMLWILGLAAVVVAAVLEGEELRDWLQDPDATDVAAARETEPVPSKGDAADDPAIFVHPDDPARSMVLGTNKKGGLGLYDLDGRLLQYVDTGNFNNVDLRDGVATADGTIVLVAASERSDEQVVLFRLDPDERWLHELPDCRITLGVDPEGVCLYRSPVSGRFHVFTCGLDLERSKQDWLEQWELAPRPDGGMDATLVRRVRFASTCEGMVADDAARRLYVAEEHVGIWRLDAEPAGGDARQLVQRTMPDGPLHADVEGLALVPRPDALGHLLASCQGSDDFVLLDRADDYKVTGRFEIVAAAGIDRVTHTDGIDVTMAPLGANFPAGLLVVQDDENDDGLQNFKLISWDAVTRSLSAGR